MTMAKKGEYEVGYGKPPSHTKYKPGQSGNPRGRPKRRLLDLGEHAFEEELLKPVTIIVNGRKQKIHPLKLIARRLVKGAIDGNFKAITLYQQLTGFQFASKSEMAERRFNREKLIAQFLKDANDYEFDK
jgi:hypothetical protein